MSTQQTDQLDVTHILRTTLSSSRSLLPGGQAGPPRAGSAVSPLRLAAAGPAARGAVGTLPMGPRLGAELELCCGGCPTSWLTEGSLLIPPPWALFIGERTGP